MLLSMCSPGPLGPGLHRFQHISGSHAIPLDTGNENRCHLGGRIVPYDPEQEGRISMSLQVPSALLERAQKGEASDADFLACIEDSLPYAWKVVSGLAEQLHRSTAGHVTDNSAPPSDAEQGQLLRALASSSMRRALERHFGVALEFQNCCKVAAFRQDAVDTPEHEDFISPRAQLLNQAPALVNC
jgi:hypothetical protein